MLNSIGWLFCFCVCAQVKAPLLLLDAANKPATTARGGSQGAPGYNYPHSTSSEAPRLKAKEKQGGVAAPVSTVHAPAPSATLQASLFHSHHKPYQSTALHAPVQGGSVYSVSEGIFYKRDLRDSHMAAQFCQSHTHTGESCSALLPIYCLCF